MRMRSTITTIFIIFLQFQSHTPPPPPTTTTATAIVIPWLQLYTLPVFMSSLNALFVPILCTLLFIRSGPLFFFPFSCLTWLCIWFCLFFFGFLIVELLMRVWCAFWYVVADKNIARAVELRKLQAWFC